MIGGIFLPYQHNFCILYFYEASDYCTRCSFVIAVVGDVNRELRPLPVWNTDARLAYSNKIIAYESNSDSHDKLAVVSSIIEQILNTFSNAFIYSL